MQVTLTNYFHHTVFTVEVQDQKLTPAQLRTAKRVLCPIPSCECSEDAAGQSGPRVWLVDQEGQLTRKTLALTL